MFNRLLCCTHTSRKMDFTLCSQNYLTSRYSSPSRLNNLPDFYTLPDQQHATDYIGGFSLWEWDKFEMMPSLKAYVSKDYKVQDVCGYQDKILVCGTNFIEIYPIYGPYETPEKIITHPWFAGGHTVEINAENEIVVSCSGPDAILFFNIDGRFLRYFRIPETIYGENYRITLEHNLQEHYISNDMQLGHMNSAIPVNEGYLCTLLIPGSIGFFNSNGKYNEIICGFVGCHGGRAIDKHTIYFSDSCNGLLIEMNWEGKIKRRFKINTVWLHDSLHIMDSLYLFSLSDSNVLELWDIEKVEMRWKINCDEYGATTQFLSVI